jgi:hypothetical protein
VSRLDLGSHELLDFLRQRCEVHAREYTSTIRGGLSRCRSACAGWSPLTDSTTNDTYS